MKNKIIIISILIANFSYSQLFFENWNSVASWTTIDGDGDGFVWTSLDMTGAGTPIDALGNTILSSSVNLETNQPLQPDNYLFFSSPINLNSSNGELYLSFDAFVKSDSSAEVSENLSFYYSYSQPVINTLQMISNVSSGVYPLMFTKNISIANQLLHYHIDISPLMGNEIYLIIRHHNASTLSTVFLDNIRIDTTLNNLNLQNLDAEVIVSDVSTQNVCDGSVFLSITGGTPPYSITNFDNSTNDSISGLCEGIYSSVIYDDNQDSVAVNYFICSPDDIIEVGESYEDSLLIAILSSDIQENCEIDYFLLDTAYISSISFTAGQDSILVTWSIIDNNNITQIIETYPLTSGYGIYQLILRAFCPQRNENKYVVIKQEILINETLSLPFLSNSSTNLIYPNPLTDILNIQLDENFATTISISDVTGKIVYQNNFDTEFIQISTSEFAKGQYFVNMRNEGHTTTKIIVK